MQNPTLDTPSVADFPAAASCSDGSRAQLTPPVPVLLEFLEALVNTILYSRGVYPPGTSLKSCHTCVFLGLVRV